MTAVKQDGLELDHVPNDIQGDKEIFLEAVRENGEAFEFFLPWSFG